MDKTKYKYIVVPVLGGGYKLEETLNKGVPRGYEVFQIIHCTDCIRVVCKFVEPESHSYCGPM